MSDSLYGAGPCIGCDADTGHVVSRLFFASRRCEEKPSGLPAQLAVQYRLCPDCAAQVRCGGDGEARSLALEIKERMADIVLSLDRQFWKSPACPLS